MTFDDQEYHRRRSEMELEQAVSSEDPTSAMAHLELARIHRARRELIARRNLHDRRTIDGSPIFRTDKEA